MKLSVLGADFLPGSSTLVEKVQNAIDPPPNQGLGLGLAPIGAKVTACLLYTSDVYQRQRLSITSSSLRAP